MTARIPPECEPLIGSRVLPWAKVEGELMLVLRLIRLCDVDIYSKSASKTWSWAYLDLYDGTQDGSDTSIRHYLDLRRRLYALLEVMCPSRQYAPAYMPIRHRFDFFKACILLDPAKDGKRHFVADDEEVLVGGPTVMEGLAKKVLRPFMPRWEFFIKPKGTFEWEYGPRRREEPPPGGWTYKARWKREDTPD